MALRPEASSARAGAGLTSKTDVEEALAELLDHHWIREKVSPTTERGGRPSVVYVINPAAREAA